MGTLSIPDGIDREAWLKLARQEGQRWAINERNSQGEIIGTAYRDASGDKTFKTGGKRGLILSWPLDPYAGTSEANPLLICEGASDTAAAMSMGFTAVGIPMAGQCGPELAELLKGRHVVIIPDADKAGERGTEKLIAALLPHAASVRLSRLPKGHKDLREWCVAGAQRDDLSAVVAEADLCIRDPQISTTEDSSLEYRPFPLKVFPKPLRSYCIAAARALQVDPGMVAPLVLSVLASAIGNSRTIELRPGWTEPSILWIVVLAPSGSGKSPTLRAVLNPLKAIEKRKYADYREAKKQYDRSVKELRKNDPSAAPPPEPAYERLLVTDATYESIIEILSYNPRGMLLTSDELASWFGGMARYSKSSRTGSEEARWLPLHAGETVRIDRRQQGHTRVERASLNLCGLIQPGVLQQMLRSVDFDGGLVPRFLVLSPPDTERTWRGGQRGLPQSAQEAYEKIVEGLYALQPKTDEHGEPCPVPVSIGPEAELVWEAYYDDLNKRKLLEPERIRAMLSKLEAAAPRMALIIHHCRIVLGEAQENSPIDEISMLSGIALAQWFEHEGRRVYAMLQQEVPPPTQGIEKLIRDRGGRINASQLCQNSRLFKTTQGAKQALSELVAQGKGHWEQPAQRGRGRSKSRIFVLDTVYEKTIYENTADDPEKGNFVDRKFVDSTEPGISETPDPPLTLPEMLLQLGREEIFLSLNDGCLTTRPSSLSKELSAGLRLHSPAIRQLMQSSMDTPFEDLDYAFAERLAIAEELGMPTHPGSPAWLVAVGESIRCEETENTCIIRSNGVCSGHGKCHGNTPGGVRELRTDPIRSEQSDRDPRIHTVEIRGG